VIYYFVQFLIKYSHLMTCVSSVSARYTLILISDNNSFFQLIFPFYKGSSISLHSSNLHIYIMYSYSYILKYCTNVMKNQVSTLLIITYMSHDTSDLGSYCSYQLHIKFEHGAGTWVTTWEIILNWLMTNLMMTLMLFAQFQIAN